MGVWENLSLSWSFARGEGGGGAKVGKLGRSDS